MRRRVGLVAGACAVVLWFGMLGAFPAPKPANLAGTWDLSMQGRRGTHHAEQVIEIVRDAASQAPTQTLTIEQDGDKIKGTLQGASRIERFRGHGEGQRRPIHRQAGNTAW